MTLWARPGGVVTLGETMGLFRTMDPEPLATSGSARISIGGAESNVAIALARLGTPATWIGRVGNDSLGERVVRELRAEGVRCRAVIDQDAPTGLMIKERRTSNAQRVWYYRSGSAGSRLNAADVERSLLESSAVFHVTGITPALSPSARAAVDATMSAARDLGLTISMDINYRSRLWGKRDAAPVLVGLARRADVLFAGPEEAALITNSAETEPDRLVRAMSDLGPTEAVLKLGSDGCAAICGGKYHRLPAVPVPVVDTVGAGDAFVAGYLAGRLNGSGVVDSLRLALQTGAFACMAAGDWEGMPRRSELEMLEAAEPVSR